MLKLASLFKWHIEARYSALNVKPCTFSEAISKNFAIATFIKKVSEGQCPLMLDFDEVETDNSCTVGVFRTQTGGTSKEPKSVLRTTQSWSLASCSTPFLDTIELESGNTTTQSC